MGCVKVRLTDTELAQLRESRKPKFQRNFETQNSEFESRPNASHAETSTAAK